MNYTYPQQQQQSAPLYKPQISYSQPAWNSQPVPQVRPVTSVEEVRACPIEFDGSIFYFPDIANKKIYTKFINMDGTVTINMYELKELATADQTIDSSSFVTRSEFEAAISSIEEMLQSMAQQQQSKPKEFNF